MSILTNPLNSDPVNFWKSAAAAHKHKAENLCKNGSAAQRYHENEAMECERKAAEAAAAHAFPTKKAANVNT